MVLVNELYGTKFLACLVSSPWSVAHIKVDFEVGG